MLAVTHADVNYVSMPLRNKYRNWILRISEKKRKSKPKFLSLIGEGTQTSQQISTSHLTMLKKLYPNIIEINYSNEDKLDKIFLQEYEGL
jgi:hypothetical protein